MMRRSHQIKPLTSKGNKIIRSKNNSKTVVVLPHRVVNPFTGKIILSTSDTFKFLQRIGLKFVGDIDRRMESKQQNALGSSSSPSLTAQLVDPTKFPFDSTDAKKKYSQISSFFKWNLNSSADSKGKISAKKKAAIGIDPTKLQQVNDYLAKGAEFWCKSILLPDIKNRQANHSSETTTPQFNVFCPSSIQTLLSPQFELTSDQAAALEIARRGHSMYIGGGAGNGKSHILKRIAVELSSSGRNENNNNNSNHNNYHIHNDENNSVAVTATTGIAALSIGGQTFHRIFQPNDPFTKFDKKSLVRFNHIIIDEISMFTATMLENFERACREARPWAAHLPFGGIQMILSGDFMQLHVERSDANWATREFLMSGADTSIPKHVQEKAKLIHEEILAGSAHQMRHVFESQIFQDHFVAAALVTKMRHQGDPELAKCLDDLRAGIVSDTFLSRCVNYDSNNNNVAISRLQLPSFENCVFLFPTRKVSDYHNQMCLDRLAGEMRIFEPKRVILSLNGDWCSPVSSLATLNLDPVLLAKENESEARFFPNHQNEEEKYLQTSNKNNNNGDVISSPSNSFFRVPKNANKLKRQILTDFIMNQFNGKSSSSSSSKDEISKNKKRDLMLQKAAEKLRMLCAKKKRLNSMTKTVRVRPGNRISLPSAQHVELRLKQKIVEEMIIGDPELFSKEPIVVHVDFNNNNSNNHTQPHESHEKDNMANPKTRSKKSLHRMSDDSGFLGGCKNQLTNGITIDKESTALPVNIRIKKTESNSLSLDKLKEKMNTALGTLARKGFLCETSNNDIVPSSPTPRRGPTPFDESIYDKIAATPKNNFRRFGGADVTAETKSSDKKTHWDSLLLSCSSTKRNAKNYNNNPSFLRSTPSDQLHAPFGSFQSSISPASTPDRDVTTPRHLKVGARVMLIRNLSPTLVNGSMGTIVRFDDEDKITKNDLPKGLFRESFVARRILQSEDKPKKIDADEEDDDHEQKQEEEEQDDKKKDSGRLDSTSRLPRVKFDNGEEVVIPYFPETVIGNPSSSFNLRNVSSLRSRDFDFSNSRISFMPLKVAFSTTVHKLQGSTISNAPVVLDLMRSWKCDHLVYVAASRVKKLDQLYILNWHHRHISVNMKAKKFTETLKSTIDVLKKLKNQK